MLRNAFIRSTALHKHLLTSIPEQRTDGEGEKKKAGGGEEGRQNKEKGSLCPKQTELKEEDLSVLEKALEAELQIPKPLLLQHWPLVCF